MPMKLLPREDVMLWLNWNLASVKWKLNSEVFKAKHLMPTRHSKRPSAASRNSNSNKMNKKNQDSMSELANKLQMKIKTYKKQIEEAEEIAALNLAKFRKAQQELEETEDRNKMAEAQLAV